jgi:predicted nicotinamide N-methyase
VQDVPGLAGIRLYAGHAGSRLSQLDTGEAPYWAYLWSGGAVLARHVLAQPQLVTGKRVLDFGSGSGVVAIAAAKAGATAVHALDTDPFARAATALNAAENGVSVHVADMAPPVDLILAGDVFYNSDVAASSMAALDAFHADGAEILVGDPGRHDLPLHLLTELARYEVPEFGTSGAAVTAAIYAYRQ